MMRCARWIKWIKSADAKITGGVMSLKTWLWVISLSVSGVFTGKILLAEAKNSEISEIRCKQINWYIDGLRHRQEAMAGNYKDNTVRCENQEVICYIYHSQLSCVKK